MTPVPWICLGLGSRKQAQGQHSRGPNRGHSKGNGDNEKAHDSPGASLSKKNWQAGGGKQVDGQFFGCSVDWKAANDFKCIW